MGCESRVVEIVDNRRWFEPAGYRLTVTAGRGEVAAGQFAGLTIPGAPSRLGRPLAVYEADDQHWQFVYQVCGAGTGALAAMPPGSRLECHGPFGRELPWPGRPGRVALVAGGAGIGAFLLAARHLRRQGCAVDLLAGFAELPPDLDEFVRLGVEVRPASEAGRPGWPVYPTDYLDDRTYDWVYACGPRPLLRAVGHHPRLDKQRTYLLLDENMACCLGTCRGCVVDTVHGKRAVCADGPAFPAGWLTSL
ncbi:MAG: hypothetical protein N3A57_02175 [Negativicutes bacterium]|nr:hypothetical protein [Negativicutes bacterium]